MFGMVIPGEALNPELVSNYTGFGRLTQCLHHTRCQQAVRLISPPFDTKPQTPPCLLGLIIHPSFLFLVTSNIAGGIHPADKSDHVCDGEETTRVSSHLTERVGFTIVNIIVFSNPEGTSTSRRFPMLPLPARGEHSRSTASFFLPSQISLRKRLPATGRY